MMMKEERHRKSSRHRRSGSGSTWLGRVVIATLFALAWFWIVAASLLVYHHHTRTTTTALSSTASSIRIAEIARLEDRTLVDSNPPLTRQQQGILLPFESPLLIFTCKRAEYLQQTLDDILHHLFSTDMGCPIVISQDGLNQAVSDVISVYKNKFAERNLPLVHLQHVVVQEQQHVRRRVKQSPYEALALHYGWALEKVFAGEARQSPEAPLPKRVIILEEDLHVAPDFFGFFARTAPLLDDPSQGLFAISAFNDNGSHVLDPKRVLRSDFFPGLGWMMPRWLWDEELAVKWPQGYWDDWLREPEQRQGRHVLRPEISRTFHFGTKGGASSNQFGGLLTQVHLNTVPIDWTLEDLSYLDYDKFDVAYRKLVAEAAPAVDLDGALKLVETTNVRLEYASFREFQKLARRLNLMDDEKAGVPRTAYNGIVETRPRDDKFLLFLVSKQEESSR